MRSFRPALIALGLLAATAAPARADFTAFLGATTTPTNRQVRGAAVGSGKGFDTSNKENFDGIGLKNITTRVEFLNGTVDFDSTPGKGTLIALHVPL